MASAIRGRSTWRIDGVVASVAEAAACVVDPLVTMLGARNTTSRSHRRCRTTTFGGWAWTSARCPRCCTCVLRMLIVVRLPGPPACAVAGIIAAVSPNNSAIAKAIANPRDENRFIVSPFLSPQTRPPQTDAARAGTRLRDCTGYSCQEGEMHNRPRGRAQ